MVKKNLLLVCGTSVATSTVLQQKLKKELPKRGIEVGKLTKAMASEAERKAKSGSYDLIVTTTSLREDRYDVPVIKTQAFMTGVGEEEVLQEIVDALKDE